MIVVVTAFFGGIAGLFIVMGWISVDLLTGMSTLTHDRGLGVVLGSVFLSQVFWVVAIGWDTIRHG
jgi:hypothetical protein